MGVKEAIESNAKYLPKLLLGCHLAWNQPRKVDSMFLGMMAKKTRRKSDPKYPNPPLEVKNGLCMYFWVKTSLGPNPT